MAQANGPTNNQQQACEITIQGLWAQTGKYLDFNSPDTIVPSGDVWCLNGY